MDLPRLLKAAAGVTKLVRGVSSEITLLIGMYGDVLNDAVADAVADADADAVADALPLWSVTGGADIGPVRDTC